MVLKAVRKFREGRTAPDASRLLFADLMIMLTGIISQVILTRLFSQSEYGRWIITIDLLRTLFLLAELGQPSLLLREIPRNLNRTGSLISRSGSMQISATVALIFPAIALIFYTIVPANSKEQWYIIAPLFAIAVGIVVLGYNPKTALRAVGRADLEGYARIIPPILFLVSLLIIHSFETTLFIHVVLGYLIANSIGLLFSIIMLLPYLRNHSSESSDSNEVYDMLRLLREGIPYLIATALTPIAFRVDKFILAATYTGGFTSVAVYNVAQMFFIASLAAPLAIRGGMAPIISKMHDDEDSVIAEMEITMKTIVFLLPIGLLIGSGLILWSIPYLFPIEYVHPTNGEVGALAVCMILLPGWIFAMLSAPAIAFIQAQKEAWMLTLLFGIAVVVNSSIGLLLIPSMGLVGASTSTVVMHLALVLVSWTIVERRLGDGFHKPSSIVPATITAVMLIAIGWIDIYFVGWTTQLSIAWVLILMSGVFFSGWRPKIPGQLLDVVFSDRTSDSMGGDDE